MCVDLLFIKNMVYYLGLNLEVLSETRTVKLISSVKGI
jgi:hypothetical protein